jgi:enoyl-CoA hydratase
MTVTSKFRTIRVNYGENRAVVTLCRPEVRNAIDAAMVSELHEVCADLESEPRILIVVGDGTIFAAGADLREMRERGREDALRGINSTLFDRIAALPLPTVAAVNGPAIGAGAELAYACDFRIASTAARFANPEVTLGIMPAAGACSRLPALVGVAVAREMLLAGRVLGADEALVAGLVSEVVQSEELMNATHALTDRISRGTATALRLTKLALAGLTSVHRNFDDVAQAVLFETVEKRDRMTEFLERRVPR